MQGWVCIKIFLLQLFSFCCIDVDHKQLLVCVWIVVTAYWESTFFWYRSQHDTTIHIVW